MKVFIAGATGAIGKPLVRQLRMDGQEVYGTTRSAAKGQMLSAEGAKPVQLDFFDKTALLKFLKEVKPDVVINMLTSLPRNYTAEEMQRASLEDYKLRWEGGKNLQEAAEETGVRRLILQSAGFFYAPGSGLADESAPFALHATPYVSQKAKVYAEIEERLFASPRLEGIALRYGFFYGPGTWYHPGDSVFTQVQAGQMPIVGKGEGVWSFVHIEDAAKATANAIYATPGAYNIVDGQPAMQRVWLSALARHLDAPPPPSISEQEAAEQFGIDHVYYATKLRGASYAKAQREFNFEPRVLEWL